MPQSGSAAGSASSTGSQLQPLTASDAFVSNGGTLRSFGQAQHFALHSDADYGRFVDASISGSARKRAIGLMELMPPGMRGDFIEIHSDGSVTSNRVDLPAMARFQPSKLPVIASGARQAQNYPPTGGQGGPYIRLYSSQGINAAYGVATPPCDVNLSQNNHDTGDMYFNAYSGSGSGSLTDAGIGADEYPGHDGNPSDVFSFVSSGGNWDPSQVSGVYQNTYESWSCGQPLVIVYGTLPSPYNGTSMLAVGPPDYDPNQFTLPPSVVTLQNPAWTFFTTPSSLNSGPFQFGGNIASNCQYCSVASMFTIGEPFADGACYGMCTSSYGVADATWSNLVMGELVAPCGPNSFGLSNPCTLEYETSNNWYAGSDVCNGTGASNGCNYVFGSPTGSGDEKIVEGISDVSYSPQALHRQVSAQTLSLPVAPSTACTPDARGYCMVMITGGFCSFRRLPPLSDPTFIAVSHPAIYYVFKKQKMLELQGTYTKSWDTSQDSCGPISWSPGDPRVVFGDSSLP